jgi:flagellar motility protein MotE (MotC chaperone)
MSAPTLPIAAAAFGGTVSFLGTLVFLLIHQPSENHEIIPPKSTPIITWSLHTQEIDDVVAELRQRQEAMTSREKQFAEMSSRVAAEREELKQLAAQIRKAQDDFDKAISRVKDDESTNLKRLAKVYATMEPTTAATIFKQMDEAAMVKILLFMKDSETAPILAAMAVQGETEAKRAAGVSERLRVTQRSSEPPKK